jgi:hypothetical protein
MPSTPSPNLRIQLIASGEQANTWGTTTNTNLGTLIEQAISGMATLTLTGATYSLSVYNYVQDEARMMVLNCGGSPGTTCTITAPAVTKIYVIANNTLDDSDVVITTGSGATVTIPPGLSTLVWCDGTNFYYGDNALANNAVYETGPTGAIISPKGTTAQRPSPAVDGYLRFNTDDGIFEGYDGTDWWQFPIQDSQSGAVTIPSGTIAERPGAAIDGWFRYNSDYNQFEGYIAGGWGPVGGGATGGGGDQVFVQNQMIVTTTYELPPGFSASSVGPIEIDSGATVTIPSGQSWVIL